MDIEGAEVDLLENLIDTKVIHKIDILYVEFHSDDIKVESFQILQKYVKIRLLITCQKYQI